MKGTTTAVPWRAFARLIDPARTEIAVLGIGMAIASVLPLAGPMIIGRFVDRAQGGADADELAMLGIVYLCIAVVATTTQVALTWRTTRLAWVETNKLRGRLIRHVLELGTRYHMGTSPGALVERVDGDCTAVADFISTFVVRAISVALMAAGMIVISFTIDVRIGAVFTLYAIVSVVALSRQRAAAVAQAVDERSSYAALYGTIEETLVGVDDVRANLGGTYALNRLTDRSAEVLEAEYQRERATLRLWHTFFVFFGGAEALMIVGGALAIRSGTISVGDGLTLVLYAFMLRRPMEMFTENLEEVQQAAGGMTRVIELADTEPDIADEGTEHLGAGPVAVTVDKLSFSYGEESVLDDIDLELPPGRHVGIVGHTGSGKSTLARLLTRQIDTDGPAIRLDGKPLLDISLRSLRSRIGLVPQQVQVFGTSIRENVALFDDSIDDARIREALHAVELSELAEGDLDRRLAMGGRDLSGGQAQLLALARLFLRDPGLVVLDEATASVDPSTEAAVQRAIGRLLEGRTAMIIAHRLSTLERVDDIVVMDDGRIVEHGERRDLLDDPSSHFAARSSSPSRRR